MGIAAGSNPPSEYQPLLITGVTGPKNAKEAYATEALEIATYTARDEQWNRIRR